MKEKIGITGEQFINKLKKKEPLDDSRVIGIDKMQFIDVLKKHNTLSDVVQDFKAMGMTDFSWGWSSRMATQTVLEIEEKQKMLEQMKSDPMLRKLAETMMGAGTTEKQKIDRDKAKLSYIE
jgi:hypothetical protein